MRPEGDQLARVPAYNVHDYCFTVTELGSLEYVPTGWTVFRRLGWTLLAALIIGPIWYAYGLPKPLFAPRDRPQLPQFEEPNAKQAADLEELKKFTEQLENRLSPEAREQLKRKREQGRIERAARQAKSESTAKWLVAAGRMLNWAVSALFVAIGILSPLSCAWQRLTIELSPEDDLVVRWRGLRSHTNSWPMQSFQEINISAREHIVRLQRPTYRRVHEGWRWFVRIYGGIPGLAGHAVHGNAAVELWVDHDKQQPLDVSRPPRRVRQLVKQLRKLTGLKDISYTLKKEASYEPGLFRSKIKSKSTTITEPRVTRHEYTSLDDVPEHLRDDVAKMMADRKPGERVVRKTFQVKVRDADGNVKTYHSLDEMPPQVREAYERGQRLSRRKRHDDE